LATLVGGELGVIRDVIAAPHVGIHCAQCLAFGLGENQKCIIKILGL
jgi:hypothetical protein